MTDVRVSQQPVEVLASGEPAARVSQQPVEVLASGDPSLRVSQQPVEVLASGDPILRVSQQVVEVLVPNEDYARLTQQGVETVASYTPTARLTQQGVETISSYTPTARMTQIGVEVLRSYADAPLFTQLDAALVSEATLTPSLNITAALDGAVLSVATLLDANLSFPVGQYLLSDLSATSTLTGDLLVPADFRSALSAESTLTGDLNILTNIAIGVPFGGEASINAALTVTSPIEAALAAEMSMILPMGEFPRTDLRATLSANPGIAGTLSKGGKILTTVRNNGNRTLTATATITANLSIQSVIALTHISAASNSIASLFAALKIDHALSASLVAINSEFSGQLRDPVFHSLEAQLVAQTAMTQLMSSIIQPMTPINDCGPVICWDGQRPISYSVPINMPQRVELEDCCVVEAGSNVTPALRPFIQLQADTGFGATLEADLTVPTE